MNNDYLDKGWSSYKKYEAQQHPNAWEMFEQFLIEENPDLIIEIGTARGEFTKFMWDIHNEHNLNFKLISFDIADNYDKHIKLVMQGVPIYKTNIFDFETNTIINKEVLNLLNAGGKKLILCDGDDKPNEVLTFIKYLEVGDIIMAHDWIKDYETFKSEYEDKIWNWIHIDEQRVDSGCKKYGFTPYNQYEWEKVAWMSKIKKSVKPII